MEYCDNLIFHRRAAVEELTQRLLDLNRNIGQPKKITHPPIPPGMQVMVSTERGFDSQTVVRPTDGSFELRGSPRVDTRFRVSVRGYGSASRMPQAVTLERDVSDYVLTLDRQ